MGPIWNDFSIKYWKQILLDIVQSQDTIKIFLPIVKILLNIDKYGHIKIRAVAEQNSGTGNLLKYYRIYNSNLTALLSL